MSRSISLVLVLLFLVSAWVQAQWQEPVANEGSLKETIAEVESDLPPSGKIEVRDFDQAHIDRLRPEHDYDQDIRHIPTFWERFKEWIGHWLEQFLGSYLGSMITENLVYILIAVILVFAAVMLSRGGYQRIFYSAPRSLGEVAVSEDDIREMDLGEMIAEAERTGDLRRAIRLHYLLVLRHLVDQQLIAWHPHFTDQDYMAQIKQPMLRSRFAHVALIFQWVWYGNAEVAPAKYEDLRRPFIEFETAKAA
ncbi:MAG: DUF4129 domain-containing protein [Bacteroidota bacterium]|nr:DUF4129 domain-containing protein [Bacteroidota bacterium]